MGLIDSRAIGLALRNTGLYWEVGVGSGTLINPSGSAPLIAGQILMENGVDSILMENGVDIILLEG